MERHNRLSLLEICAGAGGQASGLDKAGFDHELAVEIDPDAASTLRRNRPTWDVHEGDVREVDGNQYRGIDLLAGGVPCPPFSVAGKQLGADDDRDLFPEALRLVDQARPAAVMLENVKGLASARFASYRQSILDQLTSIGYDAKWQLLYSSEFGVPQLRPRFILVAMKHGRLDDFQWPRPVGSPPTVGEVLKSSMASRGWRGADAWAENANNIAPTLVGGSRKHGGADLGPTRAKQGWLKLGVNARSLADEAPGAEEPMDLVPRLTNGMAALVQGFDPEWEFEGRKTSVYRQIGNAFPPPVAQAVGESIAEALGARSSKARTEETTSPLRAIG